MISESIHEVDTLYFPYLPVLCIVLAWACQVFVFRDLSIATVLQFVLECRRVFLEEK